MKSSRTHTRQAKLATPVIADRPLAPQQSVDPPDRAASFTAVAADIAEELPLAGLREVRGNVDSCNGMHLIGWAIDLFQPAAPLWIEVWEGDSLLAAGEASIRRDDVTAAGYHGEHAGFSIALPEALRDGAAHRLTVRAAESDVVLGEIEQFTAPADVALRGHIAQRGTALVGWVEAPEAVDAGLAIELDGKALRRLALAVPPGGGRVEFSHTLLPPALLDGRVHWFRLQRTDPMLQLADGAGFAPFVATPEDALQRYANSFPGALSSAAVTRFESVQRQLEIAPVLAGAPGRAAG